MFRRVSAAILIAIFGVTAWAILQNWRSRPSYVREAIAVQDDRHRPGTRAYLLQVDANANEEFDRVQDELDRNGIMRGYPTMLSKSGSFVRYARHKRLVNRHLQQVELAMFRFDGNTSEWSPYMKAFAGRFEPDMVPGETYLVVEVFKGGPDPAAVVAEAAP